ncbi:MAG: DMT family transporter, partial [Treponemataceae bacterium]
MSYRGNAFGAILKPMQYALAPLIGVLITVMNSINSRFASAVGSLPAILVIHLVGLIAVSAVLAAKKERSATVPPPLHLYSGGIVGVGTVFCCNAAYGNLSVSLAAALALFGQTVFSVVIDATGFLGRKKYPFQARALPALALAALGIVVISGLKFDRPAYIPAALLSGILPTLTFSLNSQLAQRIGIFRSARANYLTGLSTTIAVIA